MPPVFASGTQTWLILAYNVQGCRSYGYFSVGEGDGRNMAILVLGTEFDGADFVCGLHTQHHRPS